MKYYRCPHCGEPGISAFYKNTQAKSHFISFEDILKNDKGEVCKCCNKPYVIRPRYSILLYVLAVIGVMLVPILWFVLSVVLAGFDNLLLIPLILLMPVVALAVFWLPKLMCAPLPADNDTLSKIDRLSNVSVELLEIAKNIHNYDIHAIKFDAKTENIRFKEAFTKEQVPIMFLKKTRAQITPIEAYIIKKEFVPDELLFVGSSFSIVDVGGTIIGKGRIHKIYQ